LTLKIGLYLAAIAFLCAGIWYGYTKIEQKGYDRCLAETQAENLKVVIAYADRLVKAEGERDANQTIIDRLTAESHKLQIHIPVCPSTPGVANPDGTAGLLSKRVDESFARLQERGTVLFERCEALNADAIKVNATVR
jgi:hypothetical protein